MRKLAVLILIPALLLSGCGKKEAPVAAQPEEKLVYVKTAAVQRMDFQKTLNLPGTVHPKESAVITAKVSGTVSNIKADIGTPVKKGASLCKIDDTILKLQFEKAEAAVRSATLMLERLQDFGSDPGLKPQQIEMARTAYNSAKLNLENVEKSYNRTKELYNSGSASKAEYEAAETSYNLVKEQYESAMASFKQAERGWGYDVKGAEIGLAVAENDYKMVKENLQYSNVMSPIDGIVSAKNISVGENVAPGVMLFSVVNIDSLYLESGISEKDIGYVKAGQAVEVTIDVLPGQSFTGTVTAISPALDMQSKTYPVKVELKNSGDEIKAGMFGMMRIVLATHENVAAVPKEAVINESGSHHVFVVKDQKAAKKAVKLGYSSDSHYEILEGVVAGEKVVVTGANSLKDGDKVVEK